jgi:hypothetical protein
MTDDRQPIWVVIDRVTGSDIAQYDTAEAARHHARGLNLQAGPGGRFGVSERVVSGD